MRSIYISYKGLLLIFCELLLCISSILITDLSGLAIICLMQTFLSVLLIVTLGFGVVSIPSFFVIFTWLFHASQYFLNIFDFDYNKPFDVERVVSATTSTNTLLYVILANFFFVTGVVIASNRRQYSIRQRELRNLPKFNDNKLYFIGKCLFWVCLIPRIYIDVNLIISRISGGYLSTYDNSFSGIFSTIAYGFYVGILCMVLGRRGNKKKCDRILLFSVIYICLTMFSGRRGTQIAFLIALVIMYFRYVKNTKYSIFSGLAVAVLG